MDERVVREANLTRYLRHPNIVALLDFRTDPKRFYLFYEYVKGEPLADRVGERGMLEWEAQRYFQQLVDAVGE
jgi:serine/threonine protein kinase